MPFLDRVFRRVHDFTADRDLGGSDAIISADKVDAELDNVAAGLSELKVAAETDAAELRAETRDREAAITAEREARGAGLATKANAASLGAHTGDRADPHGSAAAVRGAITAEFNTLEKIHAWALQHLATKANASSLGAHTGDRGNPHGVTAAQVGALTPEQVGARADAAGGAAVSHVRGGVASAYDTLAKVVAWAAAAFGDRYTKGEANGLFLQQGQADARYGIRNEFVDFKNVRVVHTSPHINMLDTSRNETRHVYGGAGQIGFLGNAGQMVLSVQDDGNIWTPFFGFLNKYITPKHLIVRDVRTVDAGVTESASSLQLTPRPGAGSFVSQAGVTGGSARIKAANRYVQKNINGAWYTIGDA